MLTGSINLTTQHTTTARALFQALSSDRATTVTLYGTLVDLDGDPIFAASGVRVIDIGLSRAIIEVDGDRCEVRVSSLPANARWEITRR